MDKFYIPMIGGLGDVIYDYSTYNFQKIKETYPESLLKGIVVSHNPRSIEVPRLNPFIDEIEYHSPRREMRDRGWSHKEVAEQYCIEYKPVSRDKSLLNKLYSLPSEVSLAQKIIGEKKTAIIHLFASEEERVLVSNYRSLVDQLKDKYKIILIGNSYTKYFGDRERYKIKEEIETDSNIINLIGEVSIRTAINLVIASDLFVGSWSCFSTTAWLYNKQSTVIVPKYLLSGCQKIHRNKYLNCNKNDRIICNLKEGIII